MTPRCDAIALPSLVFYGMMTLGPIGNQRGVADTDVQTSDNSFILRAASPELYGACAQYLTDRAWA